MIFRTANPPTPRSRARVARVAPIVATTCAAALGACRDHPELGQGAGAVPLEQRKAYETEARMLVELIARAAEQRFEREAAAPELLEPGSSGTDKKYLLCKSATPTPAELPSGGKGVAADVWEGSSDRGWECLGFAVPHEVHHRFSWVAGGPFQVTERGGIDLGPTGFEACAETDFTPGGETSLYCLYGTANPISGEFVVAPKPFVVQE